LGHLVQIIGAVGVLAGYALAQFGRLSQKAPTYLGLNFFGGLLLTIDATIRREWGFLLLEGAWTAVSIVGLVQLSIHPPLPSPATQVRRGIDAYRDDH
jgi:hypothetical protein